METFNQDLHNLVEIKERAHQLMRVPDHKQLIEKLLARLDKSFDEKYSFSMENVMFEIYDELCPDDKMRPIAEYIADQYIKKPGGYDAPLNQGVVVHLDDFSFKEGRLLLLPDPARIVLQNEETSHREVVWQAA